MKTFNYVMGLLLSISAAGAQTPLNFGWSAGWRELFLSTQGYRELSGGWGGAEYQPAME